jgi:hypothetical protein
MCTFFFKTDVSGRGGGGALLVFARGGFEEILVAVRSVHVDPWEASVNSTAILPKIGTLASVSNDLSCGVLPFRINLRR